MQHEQFIIQSDAQKTFDRIFKGWRIEQNPDRKDMFIEWIESNVQETTDPKSTTFNQLNEMFRKMRKS